MPQGPLVANITKRFSNAYNPIQLGQQLDAWLSQRHGKFYSSVYGKSAVGAVVASAGTTYRGANPGATPVTLSAALATTYVGLCLNNPAASTVNLVVRRVAGTIIVAPAAFLSLGLITGWTAAGVVTHSTSLSANIVNGYVGAATASGSILGTAAQGLLDSACTLVGTPLWDRWFTAANATSQSPNFQADLDDDLIIPPGGYAAIGAHTAGPTAGFLGSFMWEEVAP